MNTKYDHPFPAVKHWWETIGAKLNCNGPCEHSAEDHAAFAAGYNTGLSGGDEASNPYQAKSLLSESWLDGYHVGDLNRELPKETE